MELITEGNFIYSIRYIGNSQVKELYGYVITPDPPPPDPDQIAVLQAQIDQLKTQNEQLILMVGDLALGGL